MQVLLTPRTVPTWLTCGHAEHADLLENLTGTLMATDGWQRERKYSENGLSPVTPRHTEQLNKRRILEELGATVAGATTTGDDDDRHGF